MVQIESIVQPNSVLNDFRWESMAFVWIVSNIHPYIIAQLKLTWQYRRISYQVATTYQIDGNLKLTFSIKVNPDAIVEWVVEQYIQ